MSIDCFVGFISRILLESFQNADRNDYVLERVRIYHTRDDGQNVSKRICFL
jgi:hypothetical protein